MTRPATFTAESAWVRRAPRRDPLIRVIAIPHTGRGASVFQPWPGLLPESVEVLALQLPGREERARDRMPETVQALARQCAAVLTPFLRLPFALYGHCSGAVLGYEIVRVLRDGLGVEPVHLFPAARCAPHLTPRLPVLHERSDDDFVRAVRDLGSGESDVLDNQDLRHLLLPGLRADFEVFEQYQPGQPIRLGCPVTCLRGTTDALVSAADCDAWSEYTSGPYQRSEIAGGHFFLDDEAAGAAAIVSAALASAGPVSPALVSDGEGTERVPANDGRSAP